MNISVALCTHNGSRFIGEQVRSICLQSLPPFEIVLSDDASRDDTIAKAQEMVAACMRERPGLRIEFRVIRNDPALRVTKNFEGAVRACQGDLIALSDQDDLWVPERLAQMQAFFDDQEDLLLLHSDALLVDSGGKSMHSTLLGTLAVQPGELRQIHAGAAFDVLLRRNLVTGATTVIRRCLLDVALPFPAEWVHDEWLGIAAAAVGKVDVLEAPLIHYRQHEANQIGARPMSVNELLSKLRASRAVTHAERVRRVQVLLERLAALNGAVASAKLDKVREKLSHQQFRAHLPSSRLLRWAPVLRELKTGRYDRFGRGMHNVVRDLFEAA